MRTFRIVESTFDEVLFIRYDFFMPRSGHKIKTFSILILYDKSFPLLSYLEEIICL